ncbi:MAG: bile acid:sodium symporter family protein [Muribaculaceae bacterium]|nr:bile acid:sodium symporter family protein [Muribaculaceae bacterium]
MNPVLIVIPILTILMFDLGLTLRVPDFSLLMKQPRPVLVGLAGQIICLPAIAWLLIWAFDLPDGIAVGLMLIACCPGGSSSNVFSALAGGDVALSVSLTAFSSIITLFTMPFILSLLIGDMIEFPEANLIVQNIVLVLMPVVLGMFFREVTPRAAGKIHNVLGKLSFPALMLLAAIFFVTNRQVIIDEFRLVGLIVTILLILAMSAGWALGRLCGLDSVRRRTLVIEVGMQNAAEAIALASSPLLFNDNALAVPAIIYALMMNVVLLIYVAYFRFVPKHEN